MSSNNKHLFHLVDESPWPFFIAQAALTIVLGLTLYVHYYSMGLGMLFFGFVFFIGCFILWSRDVIREATFELKHTPIVQKGLRYGFILFIVSEVMFFFGFFWALFNASMAPTIAIGSVFPPLGVEVFNPFGVPLLNTFILLLSGVTITIAHAAIISNERIEAIQGFLATLILAVSFTGFQLMEYIEAPFSIFDGIYGSVFFMLTGFHGFHVIIGTIFITVAFVRYLKGHYEKEEPMIGFEAAAWYWHFVDVVWLFVFLFLYIPV